MIFMEINYLILLIHTIEIEPKNFINFTDAKGYKFFESIVGIIKINLRNLMNNYWYKPNTKQRNWTKNIIL